MGSSLKVGRVFLAVALVGWGVQYVLYAVGSKGPVAGPPWYPASTGVAWIAAIALVAAAVGLMVPGVARLSALLLDAGLSLRILVIHLPALIAKPRDPGVWTTLFEVLAIAGGAGVVAELLPSGRSGAPRLERIVALNARVGVWCVAVSLVVFAVQHFLYAGFVAMLIPVWIPGRVFFAYLVGVAFVAAAVAMTLRVQARLACLLMGVMFLIWVVILHAPRMAHAPASGNELTSLFVALAFSAVGFILTARFARMEG